MTFTPYFPFYGLHHSMQMCFGRTSMTQQNVKTPTRNQWRSPSYTAAPAIFELQDQPWRSADDLMFRDYCCGANASQNGYASRMPASKITYSSMWETYIMQFVTQCCLEWRWSRKTEGIRGILIGDQRQNRYHVKEYCFYCVHCSCLVNEHFGQMCWLANSNGCSG